MEIPRYFGLPSQRILSANQIIDYATRASQQPNTYWQIANPNRTLKLTGARAYVNKNYFDSQGYDRFVYWPDYRVAGTIRDIVNTFRDAGINQVQIGTLYNMSNGQIGCYRRTATLSEEVVAACSFDALNPAHQAIFNELINQRQPETYAQMAERTGQENNRFALWGQQQPYSQVTNQIIGLPEQRLLPSQRQARQQIGNELSYLPTQAFPGFPGGSQFLTAQQRGVGQYGMRY